MKKFYDYYLVAEYVRWYAKKRCRALNNMPRIKKWYHKWILRECPHFCYFCRHRGICESEWF